MFSCCRGPWLTLLPHPAAPDENKAQSLYWDCALTALLTSNEQSWSTSLCDSHKSLMLFFNLVIVNNSVSSADLVILLFRFFPNNLLGTALELFFPFFLSFN